MQRTRHLRVLSALDVRFLTNVVQRLHDHQLYVYQPGMRRAAAALILRFGTEDQREVQQALRSWRTLQQGRGARSHEQGTEGAQGHLGGSRPLRGLADLLGSSASTSSSSLSSTSSSAPPPAQRFLEHLIDRVGVSDARPSSLKLLFMRRGDRAESRWSGRVAFPGGPRDPDDVDDEHTVRREVYEELGVPLENEAEFVSLGRMRDYTLLSNSLTGFGGTRSLALSASSMAATQGVVQAQFVFLHVGDLTPSAQLARHEIESVQWMPIARLSPAYVSPDSVCHPLSSFVSPNDADKRLILSEFFHGAMLAFPSISMPSSTEAMPPQATSHTPQGSWRVWGQTLRSSSALVMLDDRPAVDWPLFTVKNAPLLQFFVANALHGYFEVCLVAYRLRAAWRYRRWPTPRGRRVAPTATTAAAAPFSSVPSAKSMAVYWHGTGPQRRHLLLPTGANPLLYAVPETISYLHVGCLLLDVVIALALVYCLAAAIYTVATAVRMALGWEDDARQSEARRLAYHLSAVAPSVERDRRLFAARKAARQTESDHTSEPSTDAAVGPPLATPSPVASEDDLMSVLAASDGDRREKPTTHAPLADQGQPSSLSNPVMQLGLAHNIFLSVLLWLVYKLVKAAAHIDWIGTFEDDATLLLRVSGESERRDDVSPLCPRDGKTLVADAFNDVLCTARVERARMRALGAFFRSRVHMWVAAADAGDVAHVDARRDTIDLVPGAPLGSGTAWGVDVDLDAAKVLAMAMRLCTAAENAFCEVLTQLQHWWSEADFEPATDRARRLFHQGGCASSNLLGRAWHYESDTAADPGATVPRQGWHPLGMPSRRAEERAVEREVQILEHLDDALAHLDQYLETHIDWCDLSPLREALHAARQLQPDFDVWDWAASRSG